MKSVLINAHHAVIEMFDTRPLLVYYTRLYTNSILFPTVQSVFYEVYINILSWMPSVVPEAMMLLFKHGDTFSPYNRVDVSHRVFNIPYYFPGHHESEMVVGIEHCAPGIKELKAFVEKEEIPLNYITEVCYCC